MDISPQHVWSASNLFSKVVPTFCFGLGTISHSRFVALPFRCTKSLKWAGNSCGRKKTKFNDFNGLMEVSYNLLNVIHVCVLKMRKHPKSLALFLPSISRKYLRKFCQITCSSRDYNTAKVRSWRSKKNCLLYRIHLDTSIYITIY